jgi:hypothetical protein
MLKRRLKIKLPAAISRIQSANQGMIVQQLCA